MTGWTEAKQFVDSARANLDAVDAQFVEGNDVFVARAPGRLDLMGGIADYSGSLVLQWPIQEATWVGVQLSDAQDIRVVSLGAAANGRTPSFSLPLAAFAGRPDQDVYSVVRAEIAKTPQSEWAAYVVGAFAVLARERGVHFDRGARILIASEVPEGKGVSSSAALEVATMQAVAGAYEIELSSRDIGLLCQIVENRLAGAPCGVMDQLTAVCGKENSLLAILCQPAEMLANFGLPDGLSVWGVDSGVRHSVSGRDYGTVRTAAYMGLAMITRSKQIDLGGYLARMSPSEFTQTYSSRLPEFVQGADFLADLGQIADPLSIVLPERSYPVQAATSHPIFEHFRVQTFFELLLEETTESRLRLLGELMYQSHNSYSACGLGSPATDLIVSMVRKAGYSRGLFGAKITGGGSGGTVAVLGRSDAEPVVREIAAQYAQQAGYTPYIFAGSSAGAETFGVRRVKV